MIEQQIVYQGELRCRAEHGPSRVRLVTDAPVDNHGKGESFSPTDLVASALASCMVTTMAIYAQQHEIELDGTSVRVRKIMTSELPRKIARLEVDLDMPLPSDHPRAKALEKAALGCPVHRSLHPDVEIPVNWNWSGK